MKTSHIQRSAVPIIWFCLSLLFSGCAGIPSGFSGRDTPSALESQGPNAASIENLWWVMFVLGTGVTVLVTGIMLFIVFVRARRAYVPEADLQPERGRAWVVWGGIVLPVIVLSIVMFFTIQSFLVLADRPDDTGITIEVTGYQWWWEVKYTGYDFETANEIRIPVDTPVRLMLTSGDVIHSFWVPELHGKMDLLPGTYNEFWIEASETGTYRSLCAEFCGIQHAKMQMMVVAEPLEAFEAWVEVQQQPAAEPGDAVAQLGQQVFLQNTCFNCHQIRGTDAIGQLGPDLTHVASRLTLGAGILENNIGNLAGWISNPHHTKPGVYMPPSDISGEELQALLVYLSTLQ